MRHIAALSVLSVICLASGCTGFEPAALGFGYNAVQTGVTYINGVDSYSYQPALYEDVLSACLEAGDSLDLDKYAEREIDENRHEIKYTFGRLDEDRMTVKLTYATAVVTKVEVNVKKKNRSGMSTLFMRVLTAKLVEMEAYDPDFQETVIPLLD